MAFFKETNRSLKSFLILFGVVYLVSAVFPKPTSLFNSSYNSLVGLIYLYCGIKFDYLINKYPKFIYGAFIITYAKAIISNLINFNTKGFLTILGHTLFYGYLYFNLVRISKNNSETKK